MNDKLKKLENLNQSLKQPPKEYCGEFLPKEFPKQFEFMFVAEMPSMSEPKNKSDGKPSNFNATKKDIFLKEMMARCGVAGSYVTDIVKARDRARRPTKKEIQKWLPFLLKEIKIIQPKAIIVLGKTNYDVNFKRFVEPYIPEGIKVDNVFHYSQQGAKSNAEIEQRFREVINEIRNT